MGDTIKITGIRAILTAPAGCNLVVVRVDTSEPGLYGLGCATFTQRYLAVKTAVEEYLRPLLVGRSVDRIEDIWQTAWVHSYWRNGPVLNNAISGVDMALWDILGKRAGMPVYQLLGGKCREGAAVYRHADGSTPTEVEDNVRRFLAEGYRHIRGRWAAMAAGGRAAQAGGSAPVPTTMTPTPAACRSSSSTFAARSAGRWSCCTTCTNACARRTPCC